MGHSGRTVTNTNTREGLVGRSEYALAMTGRNEGFTITRESAPPLEAGVYHIALAAYRQNFPTSGRLTVEITRAGAPPANPVAQPRAFTLAAPFGGGAPAWPLRITNEGGSPLNYRIDSGLPVLSKLGILSEQDAIAVKKALGRVLASAG